MPCAEKIDSSLRHGREAEHAALAEEPGRGHGGDVGGGAVGVFGGDEEDDGTEVEDGRGDGVVHCGKERMFLGK